jgi:hypothetical protein
MQDETRRKIITWYIRFDLFAANMAGGETSLSREWFVAAADFYTRQVRDRPMELGAQFEEFFAISRLLATDVALLFAARSKNTISDEQFASQAANLGHQAAAFGHRIQTAYTDPACFTQSFPNAPPPQKDEITNFRDPYFLYSDELYTMNYVLIDFWAIDLMFRYQLAHAQQQPLSPELTEIALKKCKMFEAIQYYDRRPPGAILGCQASLGIASLFLPKDERHTMWCRRKFALIEQNG